MSITTKKWLVTIMSGVIIWLIPVPAGVKPVAWNLLAVFIATIVGFIAQPIPMGAIAILSLVVASFSKLAKPAELLAGFSNATIWLIVAAFILSRGFAVTGLGRRISYILIKMFGNKTIKLGYAIVASEYIFCLATPSSAARGGAIIYPIVRNLASAFGSEPGEETQEKIGAYLMQVGFQANCMSGALFLTAMIANPMAALFANQAFGITVSWIDWAVAAIVPGTLAMLLIPLVIFYLIPPEIKETPQAQVLAHEELSKMGPMKTSEKIMAMVFLGCVLLWLTATYTKLNATMIALAGGAVLLVFRAITWKDVLAEHGAWDTMVWIGSLVSLATLLNKYGLIAWFSKAVSGVLVSIPWIYTLIIILLLFLYTHYLFASLTAHTTALYPAFIAIAGAAGAPPMLVAISMGVFSNFCAGLTHYGNGVAPIYFGAGYMSQARWWKTGLQMSWVYIFCWLGVGMAWWKIIGLW